MEFIGTLTKKVFLDGMGRQAYLRGVRLGSEVQTYMPGLHRPWGCSLQDYYPLDAVDDPA